LLFVLRRLILGILLIIACAVILLLLDLNHRNSAAVAKQRKWKVTLIEFVQVLDVEECEKGLFQGLNDSKLIKGRDFDLEIMNAQGDMPTVSSLIDAAVTNGSDLIITMSTPTLQAAIKRAGRTPVVFTYVADAVAAGAAKSDTDHLPNVTGVYFQAAFEDMLKIMKQTLPDLHSVGGLYVPAETNMVFYKGKMDAAAQKAGINFVWLPVNTSTDVPDATLALCSQKIDAICQVPGNLLAASFPSLVAPANQARIPIFAFQTSQVYNGAVMALGRDYFDAGHQTAEIAARVIRGESPGKIPLINFSKTKVILNYKAAKNLNLKFPQSLIQQAKETIGEP